MIPIGEETTPSKATPRRHIIVPRKQTTVLYNMLLIIKTIAQPSL